MKKWLPVVLALVLWLAPAVAYGETISYFLPDVDLELSLPADWYTVTRDTPPDHMVFLALDQDYQETMADFAAGDVYLDSWLPDFSAYLTVYMLPQTEVFDFRDYSDQELQELGESWLGGDLEQQYAVYDSCTLYDQGQTRFIVSDGTSSYGADLREYYTIFNGQAVIMELCSLDGPIEGQSRQTLDEIASSLHFTMVRTQPNGPEPGDEGQQPAEAAGRPDQVTSGEASPAQQGATDADPREHLVEASGRGLGSMLQKFAVALLLAIVISLLIVALFLFMMLRKVRRQKPADVKVLTAPGSLPDQPEDEPQPNQPEQSDEFH